MTTGSEQLAQADLSARTGEKPVSRLTCDALREALRAAVPGAALVPAWLLREVIAHDRDRGGVFSVPHRHVHVIERERLARLAGRERLPLDGEVPEEPVLVLLPRPEADWLASVPAQQALLHYWRLLFHARVDAELRRVMQAPSPGARSHAQRLGRGLLHEARLVLREEKLLHEGNGTAGTAGEPDAEVCAEFLAVFLELFYFDRPMLERFFPSVEEPQRVLDLVRQDLDVEGLLRQTRPPGACGLPEAPPSPAERGREPTGEGGWDEAEWSEVPEDEPSAANRARGRREQDALMAAAARAAEAGNAVRAAILHARAYALGGPRAGVNRAGKDLDALAARLSAALGLDEASARAWRGALRPLLPFAARGWWNNERRLLYDLQKVCVDCEREVYSVNLVEWVLDLGRRPLRRPLPRQRLVLVVKHLHSAESRLVRSRLPRPARVRLAGLLRRAIREAENRLRGELSPLVGAALDSAELCPHGAAEAVGREKVIEELLDEIADKGFLSMGEVRDAISRNTIKLHDLRGAKEFVRGDQLLRIDRRLGAELDGVYRRGEFYLRLFQRGSSLLFADKVGRLLTRTLLVPLGGAFLILEGLEHTIGLLIHLIFRVHLDLGAGFHGPSAEHAEHSAHAAHAAQASQAVTGWKVPGLKLYVDHPWRFLVVAVVLFLLFNWPAFRAAAGWALRHVGRGLRWFFVDAPEWLASRPLVRAVARSRALRLATRYVLKPLVPAALVWWLLPHALPRAAGQVLGAPGRAAVAAAIFAIVCVLLNSRHARQLEGALLHGIRVGWEKLTGNILAGLFHLVMSFFQRVLEDVERMLYQVDEWLRFRSGQGQRALVGKAVLGVFWFYIAYVVRFVINLLVEPQINPIKHFPVVTVSHKIILPQAPRLAEALEQLGMAKGRAVSLALPIVFVIPGMFGFLAWELLSNWKLYDANRPRSLKPVQVGSHGESVARLLRPGIHSGTVPKIFARLRRAAAREGTAACPGPRYARPRATAPAQNGTRPAAAGRPAHGRRAHRQLRALGHVREEVEHFMERELIALLARHPAWRDTPVHLGEVTLAPTRIAVQLLCPELQRAGGRSNDDPGNEPLTVSFQNWSGWIVTGVDQVGWAAALPDEKKELLSVGLLGLYKMAGVDLVREQVDSVLADALAPADGGSPQSQPPHWDVRARELVVWLGREGDVEVAYELTEGPLVPHVFAGDSQTSHSASPPTLDSSRLILTHTSVEWRRWVEAWEPNSDPKARAAVLGGATILPDRG